MNQLDWKHISGQRVEDGFQMFGWPKLLQDTNLLTCFTTTTTSQMSTTIRQVETKIFKAICLVWGEPDPEPSGSTAGMIVTL